MTTGFSKSTKFLILVVTIGGMAAAVWLSRASGATQVATTLKLASGPGGIENGLVGHWTFDGIDMLQGQVVDRSGNGNHGSQVNMSSSTAYAPGTIGQGLALDGVNDYVELPVAAATAAVADDVYSWTMWVRIRNLTGTQIFMSATNNNGAGDSDTVLEFFYNPSGLGAVTGNSGGLVQHVISAPGWYHLGAAREGSSLRFYVNGTLIGTDTSVPSVSGFTPTTFRFGRPTTAERFFGGTIDDARLYTRALSADEVKHLYQLGATTKVATTPSQPSTGTGLNAGRVGHWTFDGNHMPGGQVNDISGNGNHGSMRNMASSTAYVKGRIGQALKFDGSNDLISVPDHGSLDPIGDLSVAAWVKMDLLASQTGRINSVIFKRHSASPFQSYALYQQDSGGNIFSWCWSGVSVSYKCANSSAFGLAQGVWYHLVGVKTGDVMNLYLNGALLATGSGATGAYLDADSEVAIGAAGVPSEWFPGTIDDVRIYNRALSADEIKQLHQMGR